ncbi:transactivating tegument protein VP16 [Falconid herpesvirus 1]|uniref:Alpha trans-inducing protein n=1 Tax=Falconid herpesvirus 1 TaxID=1510155 RepID=A0A068EW02_9ALPH|nr:transactivating tegument protein VP16 [Falconid herpesvirus 1]AID52754.1 transactivating tegument protein VP16 [Falconid herpesvirus 1]
MDDFYGPCELFAEIEAYAAAMGDRYSDEGARRIADFDESLLTADSVSSIDAMLYEPVLPSPSGAPSARKLALPPPRAAPPGTLYTRLLRELEFPEGPALLTLLEKLNADMFSCMPINEHLYREAKLLSVSPEDILAVVEDDSGSSTSAAPINLNAHGALELPVPPDDEGNLSSYVAAVQDFFLSELEAREKAYIALFLGYCHALASYIRRAAYRELRTVRGKTKADEVRSKARKFIASRYYREAARFAKLIYLHLYLTTTRETSTRLRAVQFPKQNMFVYMRYDWRQERQFWCLFHPVLFNHGVVLVEGRPLLPRELRALNFIRTEFGLPVVRCGLVEEPGTQLTEMPSFSGSAPRAAGFLVQLIRAKMETYSRLNPKAPPAPVALDHPYAKSKSGVNYGSSVEGLTVGDPDPERPLPGDPVPPPAVSVAPPTPPDSGEESDYPPDSASPRSIRG